MVYEWEENVLFDVKNRAKEVKHISFEVKNRAWRGLKIFSVWGKESYLEGKILLFEVKNRAGERKIIFFEVKIHACMVRIFSIWSKNSVIFDKKWALRFPRTRKWSVMKEHVAVPVLLLWKYDLIQKRFCSLLSRNVWYQI